MVKTPKHTRTNNDLDKTRIEIQERSDGVVLSVRAVAGARKNAILGVRDGALRVAVTQVAEKGKANQAIIKLLAKQWRLARSRIVLVSGAASANKKLLIADISAKALREWLETWRSSP